jgi:hypothetical protein
MRSSPLLGAPEAKLKGPKSRLDEISERIERIDRDVITAKDRMRELSRELIRMAINERDRLRQELSGDVSPAMVFAGDQMVADLAYIRLNANGHYADMSREWSELPKRIDELEAERQNLWGEQTTLQNEARVPGDSRALVAEVEQLKRREQELLALVKSVKAMAVDTMTESVPKVVQVLPHGFGLSNGEFHERALRMTQAEMQGLFELVRDIIIRSLLPKE